VTTLSGILEKIIEPQRGGFSADLAKYVLSLNFAADQQKLYEELSRKAQEGPLSDDEQEKIDGLLSANAFLMVLQSKARISLRQHGFAA